MGFLLLVIAAGGYAFFPIFAKWAYSSSLTPLDLLSWRFFLAAPLIWLVIAQGRSWARFRELPVRALLLMGALFAFVAMFALLTLERVPASTYTVLLYTYPAFVTILARFLGQPMPHRAGTALALTLIGVILTAPGAIDSLRGGDPLGIIFSLLNSILYAVYIVISSRLLAGKSALIHATALSITGSLLVMIAISAVRGVQMLSGETWLIGLGFSTISTVIPIAAFYAGMQKVGAARAAIISTLEPVFTLALSVILLAEQLQLIQLLGAVFILSGALLLQTSGKFKRRPAYLAEAGTT